MGSGKVIVITVFTSLLVSSGSFFALRAVLDEHGTDDGVVVPPLAGLRTDQARRLLEDKGLLLIVTAQREHPRIAEGLIAEQVPLEGSKLKAGSEVKVVVSTGMKLQAVPALAGMSVGQANAALTAAGFMPGAQTRQASATVAADAVITSTPGPGTKHPKGTKVALVLSQGPEGVEVPKVVFKRLYLAKKLLSEAGFKLGRVRRRYDEDRMGGVVLSQSPEPGTKAPKGSDVDLVVNEDD